MNPDTFCANWTSLDEWLKIRNIVNLKIVDRNTNDKIQKRCLVTIPEEGGGTYVLNILCCIDKHNSVWLNNRSMAAMEQLYINEKVNKKVVNNDNIVDIYKKRYGISDN